MFDQMFITEVPQNAMEGTYTSYLVILSYVVAAFGSYTGLSLASEYIKAESRRLKMAMLVGGAASMGCSIWSMHFIGMLAYKMDMTMSYNHWLTGLSAVLAVAIAFGFFQIVTTGKLALYKQAAAAVVLGAAICAMHYTGMAAMRMKFVSLQYQPWLVALSVAIAMAASAASLWIFAKLETLKNSPKKKMLRVLAGMVMGAAICGMHYTGMKAAVFIPDANMCFIPESSANADSDGEHAVFLAGITGLLIGIALSLKIFRSGKAFFSGSTGDVSFPIRILGISLVSTCLLLLTLFFGMYTQNSFIDAVQGAIAPRGGAAGSVVLTTPLWALEAMARKTDMEVDRMSLAMMFAVPAILIAWVSTVLGVRKWGRDLTAAKQQSDTANAAKSDFLANISHDLRTPMNGIIGLSQLLVAGKTYPEQDELLQAIVRSGESLLLLVNDILDISKMEAGELTLEEAPFNMKQSIGNVIELLAPLASKKGLILNYQYCDMAPSFVIGDSMRVNQIVTNLVGNAIKFTESGSVSVFVDAEVSKDARIYNYNIRVVDTGIGIKPEVQEKLFRKFVQGDASCSRKFGGTGLGLAIIRMLATKMQGQTFLESELGKGSTFRVQIPLKTATAKMVVRSGAGSATALRTIESFAQYRVLVVDDHPVNRLYSNKLLQKKGFKLIEEAVNGAEALQKIRANNHDYDIILMDCQMPEMDGFEVTRAVRDMENSMGNRHVPIIAMTANAMVGDRLECLKAGMDDYISKPVNPESLRTSLSHWLLESEKRAADTASAAEALSPVAAAAPVDLGHIALFTDGDPAEEKIMSEMFISSGFEIIDVLRNHLAGEKTDSDWQGAAHKLKGSALQIGARSLADACLAAESEASAAAKQKEALLEQVETRFFEVRNFFIARQSASF